VAGADLLKTKERHSRRTTVKYMSSKRDIVIEKNEQDEHPPMEGWWCSFVVAVRPTWTGEGLAVSV
jgi:hypothetical protein